MIKAMPKTEPWGQWIRRTKAPPVGKKTERILRSVDLFCGCGGLSLGLEEACRRLNIRVEIALAVDVMDAAKAVYMSNFQPENFVDSDISELIDGELGAEPTTSEKYLHGSLKKIDVLLAGPPCQGHSDLNNHSRRDDPRNDLYLRAARAVELLRPKYVLIENVQTVTRSKTKVVQRTVELLSQIGYTVREVELKASNLGLPQRRTRHFTLGVYGGIEIEIPNGDSKEGTLEEAIGDLIDLESTSDSIFDTSARHQPQNVARIAWLFGEGWTEEEKRSIYNKGTPTKPEAFDLINARRPKCHQNGHSYPAVYGRMKWNEAAPTITTGFGSTGQGRFVHPLRPRTLTPHEAARVQTFPDFFSFSAETRRARLQDIIGNAVPPLMAAEILQNLLTTEVRE